MLRQAVQQIEAIADLEVQANLIGATYVISGLALDQEIIQRLLRTEIVKESVTYQEILREGEAKGQAKGEAKGKSEGLAEGEIKATHEIALNMLRSNISVDLIAQFTGLSLAQIRNLIP